MTRPTRHSGCELADPDGLLASKESTPRIANYGMKRTTTPREDDTAAVDRNDDDNQGETPGQQRMPRCSAPERHMLWVCFYSFYTNLFYLVRTQRPTQQWAELSAQGYRGKL